MSTEEGAGFVDHWLNVVVQKYLTNSWVNQASEIGSLMYSLL